VNEQARVVVIGGGITGVSVAYHLAEAGCTDVLLVDKAGLTAGSTSQAAGLVTAFNPSSTMLAWRRYSIELYGRLGAFSAVGSLRLASSPEQLKELERTASRARGVGLDVGVIGAEEARRLMPAISPDEVYAQKRAALYADEKAKLLGRSAPPTWYEDPIALGTLLLLCPPIGLAALWSSKRYSNDARWALTVMTALTLCVGAAVIVAVIAMRS